MEKTSPLEQEIMLLRQELAAKNNSLQEKNNHIKILEEYILSLKQKQFGSSSEKLSPTQAELFDEADGDTAEIEVDHAASTDTIEIPAHTRSTVDLHLKLTH